MVAQRNQTPLALHLTGAQEDHGGGGVHTFDAIAEYRNERI